MTPKGSACHNSTTQQMQTELLRFLGVLQFFSAHIDHLLETAAPLYQVL
jgi:hypothetical protein